MRLLRPSLALALISLASPLFAGDITEAEAVQLTRLDRDARQQRIDAMAAMTPAQQGEAMVAQVHDRTIIYYQQGHGIYVEYTDVDGRVYMWYPYNGQVVYGTWALREQDGLKLCYHYLNSYNGVTKEYEPTECIPPSQALVRDDVLDSRPGDPFGLKKRRLPYSKRPLDLPAWPATAQ